MKRLAWISLMVLAIVAAVFYPSGDAAAFFDCSDKSCTLNIHCIVECPPCDGGPSNPGHCQYE